MEPVSNYWSNRERTQNEYVLGVYGCALAVFVDDEHLTRFKVRRKQALLWLCVCVQYNITGEAAGNSKFYQFTPKTIRFDLNIEIY